MPRNQPLFDAQTLRISCNRYLDKDMSASFGPFETRTLIYGLYIDECLQVSISTLLVYDTCEYKNTLITPFSTTLNTVITFDKEASTMISVKLILMHFL